MRVYSRTFPRNTPSFAEKPGSHVDEPDIELLKFKSTEVGHFVLLTINFGFKSTKQPIIVLLTSQQLP